MNDSDAGFVCKFDKIILDFCEDDAGVKLAKKWKFDLHEFGLELELELELSDSLKLYILKEYIKKDKQIYEI